MATSMYRFIPFATFPCKAQNILTDALYSSDHVLFRGLQETSQKPSNRVPEPVICDLRKTAIYESLSTVSESTFDGSPVVNTPLPLSKFSR